MSKHITAVTCAALVPAPVETETSGALEWTQPWRKQTERRLQVEVMTWVLPYLPLFSQVLAGELWVLRKH